MIKQLRILKLIRIPKLFVKALPANRFVTIIIVIVVVKSSGRCSWRYVKNGILTHKDIYRERFIHKKLLHTEQEWWVVHHPKKQVKHI